MFRFYSHCLLLLLLLALPIKGEARQRVGVVLSGGGAKGVAHIGVIKVLEDNNIPIDYIAGTSMGAIIAGLYASGYSPDEMLQLVTSQEFLDWSSGTIAPELHYYFSSPEPSPTLVNFPIGNDSIAKKVPQCLIGPNAMNFPFMRIFAAQTAACNGNFDKLFVPLRTVSSNLKANRGEVARSGDLTTAVRASMSIPIVFCPVEINDTLHYDGGIYDNFPVDVMRNDFHPDIIIGSDVHTPDPKAIPNIINQVDNLAVRPQTYAIPADEGIKIHIDLSNFTMLDFAAGQEIYLIGLEHAHEMIDSISARVTARRELADVQSRRAKYKRSLPTIEFDKVICSGASAEQNNYIKSLFRQSKKSGKIEIEGAKKGYYRAISSGQLANLRIEASPESNGGMLLLLNAYPRSPWSVDLGAYITTNTTNMVFAALNYRTLNARSINGSFRNWIGINYLASELLADIRFGGEHPYSLGLQAVVSRYNINNREKYFFQVNDASYVKQTEAFARANIISVETGSNALARFQAGYGYKSAQCNLSDGKTPRIIHRLAQLALRYDQSTLNAINFPTNGLAIHSSLMGLLGKNNDRWIQLDAEAVKYWNFHRRFSFGLNGHLLASSRKPSANTDIATMDAPEYMPTAACFNALNPSFRAYSFLGAGVNPVWLPFGNFQLRGSFNIFAPWKKIGCDRKLHSAQFLGQITAVYQIKKITANAFCSYRTGQRHERGFHAGIALGIFLPAPEFLR